MIGVIRFPERGFFSGGISSSRNKTGIVIQLDFGGLEVDDLKSGMLGFVCKKNYVVYSHIHLELVVET